MTDLVYSDVKGEALTPSEANANIHNLDDRIIQLRADVVLRALITAVATLNNAGKVIQTALNSEKLDGKTFAQVAALFVAAVEKGAALGVAELDDSGVLKASQRPVTGSTYKGAWDAAANDPAIPAAAAGNTGWFYKVANAGTTSIGGIAVWSVGDEIRSNGVKWERIPAYNAVVSIAGKSGVVTLAISDIAALQASLDAKLNSTVETHEMTFNTLTVEGDFFKADLAGMSDTPEGVATGSAFVKVRVFASAILQAVTLQSNNTYTRVFNIGAWSGWNKLN